MRNTEHFLDVHKRPQRLEPLEDDLRRGDRPEHHFRRRVRGDDVWRHAPFNQPDRVIRRAQIRIRRQLQASQPDQRIDQQVDGRDPLLGTRRVCGLAPGMKAHAEVPPRGQPQPAVGRLTIYQVLGPCRGGIRHGGAVAPAFLPHDEKKPDPAFPLGT